MARKLRYEAYVKGLVAKRDKSNARAVGTRPSVLAQLKEKKKQKLETSVFRG